MEEACRRGGLGGSPELCGLLPVLQFPYVRDAILLQVNQEHSRRSAVPVLSTRDSFLRHSFQGYLSSEEHPYTVASQGCVLSKAWFCLGSDAGKGVSKGQSGNIESKTVNTLRAWD